MKFTTQLLSGAALALALSNPATAATLNISADGILMGASGVDVGGVLYDVVFKDDYLANSISAFTSQDSATLASQALIDQVFTGIYDTTPNLTNGCSNLRNCYVVTGYEIYDSGLSANVVYVQNSSVESSDSSPTTTIFGTGVDTTPNYHITLAFWTKQASAVPEPGAYALMLAGLGLVGFAARRKLS